MEQFRKKGNVAYFASITANILCFCLGTTMTWTSTISSKIQNITNGTTAGESIIPPDFIDSITFSTTIASSISAYFYTHIADKFGRKMAILSLGVPYLMAYLVMGLKRSVKTYLIARFVIGLAVGGTFSVIPIYAGEISNKFNRATLNSIGGVMIAAGALFCYVLGPYISINNLNLILASFPALFLVLFFIHGEETPHFYIFKKQEALARQALIKLKGFNENIDQEFENIQNVIKEQSKYSMIQFIQKKTFIKTFTSVIGLLIFQQITGINAVLMFNETIYELTESNFDSEVCCVIAGIVQFFSSLFVLTFEEKFYRKTLLITSAVAMAVLLTILGFHYILIDYHVINDHLKLLPLVVLSLFIISYLIGIGPIPFVILSETLPWRVKSLSISVISTIYWITVFLIVKYFQSFVDALGLGSCFLSLAVLCLFTVAFVYFFVEETKGKTFEEIQDIFNTPN